MIKKVTESLFSIMLLAAAGCFLFAAGITVLDVITRSFFSITIPAVIELTSLFVGLGALLSMPKCYSSNSHITAKLVSEFTPKIIGRVLFYLGAYVSLFFAAMMFGITFINASENYNSPQTTADAGLPIYILLILVAIGFLVALIAAIFGVFPSKDSEAENG